MRLIPTPLLALVIVMAHPLMSCTAQSFGHLSVNDIRARFYSHGMIGRDAASGDPDFEVPVGSGVSPFYAGSLWIGGLDSAGTLRLAALRYDQILPSDYAPGPLTTDGTASVDSTLSAQYDHVWSITAGEVADHQAYFNCLQTPGCDVAIQFPGYVIPSDILSWPGNGDVLAGQASLLAPFIDADGDGVYEPSNGDAPCIQGDQALYFIFNDKLTQHSSGGQPIGVEVHAMPFAFDTTDPALAHTVFIKYRVINRSSETLYDATIGLFTDFDLGNSNDDRVGCDPARGLWYVYNGDLNDQTTVYSNGYGLEPPAFGGVLLQGAPMDANGYDDQLNGTLPSWNGEGFGDLVADNELLGLSRVRYFDNSNGVRGEPSVGWHHWAYLNDRWKDSTLMYYGGTGYGTFFSTVPAQFAFPDDTDPLGAGTSGTVLWPWSEVLSNNAPADRRALGITGPFTLHPGQEVELYYALTYARAGAGGPFASVASLQQRTDSVRAYFQALSPACSAQGSQVGIPELLPLNILVHPNPCTTEIAIAMNRPGQALVSIVDGTGRLVIGQRSLPANCTLDVSQLAAGLFMLIVEIDDVRRRMPFVKQP
jgi:hypothetical protein